MGNVGSSTQETQEGEEWLQDLEECELLDFSRKVNHEQYLKVRNKYLTRFFIFTIAHLL